MLNTCILKIYLFLFQNETAPKGFLGLQNKIYLSQMMTAKKKVEIRMCTLKQQMYDDK